MSSVSAEELDALEAALLEELERKKAAAAAPVATPATRTRLPEPTRSYAKQTARTAATAPRKFAPKAATPDPAPVPTTPVDLTCKEKLPDESWV